MKQLFYLLLCAPLLINAQETSAIKWAQGLSWQQVKQKAKKENKYIFVDCFATWCVPCKKMDKEVYALDSIGNYLNAGFISVRVQMDSTKSDDISVKSWYKTASFFEKEYQLSAYPTLLFFSPSGEMVFKESGYKAPENFLQLARDAKDPSKQYYLLVRKYKKGRKDYLHMPYLIKTARQLNDTATYRQVINDYYAYLYSLPKDKLYTKENIEFVASTLESPSQILFSMFYPDGKKVNEVMQKYGYAKKIVDALIKKQKVYPFMYTEAGSSKPDWNILYKYIEKEYVGDYADRNVLDAKVMWFIGHQDYLKAATFLNDKMEKYGTDTTDLSQDFIMNNQASLLWAKLDDTVQLNRMIRWVEGIVRRSEKATDYLKEYWPYYMDTYANLLYKVGRTSEAIKWEELAVTKGRERNIDKNVQKAIEQNLEMMRNGKPTWLPDDAK